MSRLLSASKRRTGAKRRPPRNDWRKPTFERDATIRELREQIATLEFRATQEAAIRMNLSRENQALRRTPIVDSPIRSLLAELVLLCEKREKAKRRLDFGPIIKRCRSALGWA